jgi:hypothetical protein
MAMVTVRYASFHGRVNKHGLVISGALPVPNFRSFLFKSLDPASPIETA